MPQSISPAVLLVALGLLPAASALAASQPLLCAQLAGVAGGLVGTPGIKSVDATVVPAVGNNVSYCQVNVLYGTSPEQNTCASACRSGCSTGALAV